MSPGYRQHPTKTVDPETNEWMGTKRASLYGKAHGDGGGVPSRCRQSLENCLLGRVIVQMKRLRVKFGRKLFDLIFQDFDGLAFETHA